MLQRKYSAGVEIVSLNENDLRKSLKDAIVRIKLKHPAVRQIILFGSFSKNNFTPYSDVDIAIILEDTKTRFIKRQDEFIDYFLSIPLDVNLLVYTEREFDKMLKEGNAFVREITNGIRL